jgi:TatD DNase family protein
MWIDTHCHLDASEFNVDRLAILERARQAGVGMLVIPAVQLDHFSQVQTLARTHGLAYALGIHPLYTPGITATHFTLLRQALAQAREDPHLVAVGEIGLDYFVTDIDREHQMQCYIAQIQLAREFELPVILHVRRSADDLLKVLRQHPVVGGIAHAFNGSQQQAEQFISRGFALGFGGTLTFDRALQIRRLAQTIDQSAIVLETDAPDIPPQWLYQPRANRIKLTDQAYPSARNEPAQLVRIAESLSALRGWNAHETATNTMHNAIRALPRLKALLPHINNAAPSATPH